MVIIYKLYFCNPSWVSTVPLLKNYFNSLRKLLLQMGQGID